MERSLVGQYFDRFGEAGDFDRWRLPAQENLALMADALRKGRPVTDEMTAARYEALHGIPYVIPPDEDPEVIR